MAEPKLTIKLELEGRVLDQVEAYTIDSSYVTPTDGFSVSLYDAQDRSRIIGLEMEPVELILDEASQLIGRFDKSVMGNDLGVQYQGRDFLGDATECNVDPTFKVQKGALLGDVIIDVGGPVGIDAVAGSSVLMSQVRSGKKIDGSKPAKTFQAIQMEELKPEPGITIAEFWETIVSRHGTTYQPGEKRGQVVLTAPNYTQSPLYRLRRKIADIGSGRNNIETGSAARDFSSFATFLLFSAKAGKKGQSKKDLPESVSAVELADEIGGELAALMSKRAIGTRRKPLDALDALAGKLYRFSYMRDEKARNAEQLLHSASRAFGERLKDTLVYECTVDGFIEPESGAFWAVDTVVEVNDEVAGVNEPMWIESRTFKKPKDGPATTDLVCWRLGSFVI